MTEKERIKLWEDYAKTKDAKIKEVLIIEYSPLVKYVAARLNIYLGKHIELEDLISYGIFGLIDAIDKFDIEKGVKFETYASLRIRGSILDNVRKLDWVPRTLRQKQKQFEQVYSELENNLGRFPTDEEVADKLNISISELQEFLNKNNIASLISLDEYVEQNYEIELVDMRKSANDEPEQVFEKKEIKENLAEAINKLSDKEKTVISLYYFEELTLKEISIIMKISESRVSQIHTKAVSRLRMKSGKYKDILYNS